MADTKTNYLAKLLTLLVKRESGVIKIPAADLMGNDIGQGFHVHFSEDTKELVLTYVPAGSTIYRIEAGVTWLSADALPQQRQEPKPLTQADLVAKAWSESAATPTNQEVREPKNRVIHLTDASQAAAEIEKRKQAALRELENFPGKRVTEPTTRSSRVATFSKP